MLKQTDPYSFALGVCEAFCEVVRAGVKRVALSHPFTEDELQNTLGEDFLPACEIIAQKYGCKAYYLKEPLITDLFPVSLNRGKQNVVFYREDRDLEEFLSIQRNKQKLIAENNYTGEDRRQIAVRYGHLLSYSDEAIARYLVQNTELELPKEHPYVHDH